MNVYVVESDVYPMPRSNDEDEERYVLKYQTSGPALFPRQAFVVCGLHPRARPAILDVLLWPPKCEWRPFQIHF